MIKKTIVVKAVKKHPENSKSTESCKCRHSDESSASRSCHDHRCSCCNSDKPSKLDKLEAKLLKLSAEVESIKTHQTYQELLLSDLLVSLVYLLDDLFNLDE